jgi:capsular polysaccharide transport system permease protein
MSQAAGQASLSRGARQLRRARARRLLVHTLLWIGFPTLVAAIYYGLVATPQYESVAVATVQSNEQSPSLEPLAAMIASSGSGRDAFVIRDFIRSRAMLEALEKGVGFSTHYGRDAGADLLSRLRSRASSEDRYAYFRKVVDVEHDAESGALTVRVRAFTADAAQAIAEQILALAEQKVNELSARARRDRIDLAEREVRKAEERLKATREKLLALQDQGVDFDPERSAAQVISVRTQLEGELAKAYADLDVARAVMQPDAPRVVELRQRVRALERQIQRQNQRLVGAADDDSLSESIARVEPAIFEKEFAESAYAGALKSLEMARLDADRKHQYLATIAPPSRPDAPTHPRRMWKIATVLFGSLVIMGVFTLIGAAVREHAKF